MEEAPSWITTADYALIGLGGVVWVSALCVWLRRGRRDPLRGSPIRINRITPLVFWFALLGYVFAGGLGLALSTYLVPPGLSEIARTNWQGVVASCLMQVATIIGTLALAAWAFRAGWRGFGLRTRGVMTEFLWALGGWLAGLSLCTLVAWATEIVIHFLNPGFEPPDHDVFAALKSDEMTTGMQVLVVSSAAILAPIGEEFFFRGILQTALAKVVPARWGSLQHRWIAILLAASAFGLMHSVTPQYIPALIVLGIILGYLYERRGSLAAPILVHVLFNAKSLLWYYLVLWLTN